MRNTEHFEEPAPRVDNPVQLGPGMVCAGNRNGIAGTAERLPTVYRVGAFDALECPSLVGHQLRYRDGRVVDVREAQQQWEQRNADLREEYSSGFDGPMP